MGWEWVLLLLPLAAASGWFAARGSYEHTQHKVDGLARRYIVGLNYLLNEQSDEAIDTFVRLLEVDSETVETHLALGSLFRRRGEVDRALRLHQNIIARPSLSAELRQLAMYELGQDYMAAGVLDRAEHIFDDLKTVPRHRHSCLHQLLSIHQQTRDWPQAVAVARSLDAADGEDMQVVLAHFYCEMAEESMTKSELGAAQGYLHQALKIDRRAVRVSLLQAEIAQRQSQWKHALGAYRNLLRQDPGFFGEALDGLKQCFHALNDPKGLFDLLQQAVAEGAGASVILEAAAGLRKQQGDRVAAEFLTRNLRINPSLLGLQSLIQLHLLHAGDKARESLLLLQEMVQRLLAHKSNYRCRSCGFEAQKVFWQCPSCKAWGTVTPIVGLEGE